MLQEVAFQSMVDAAARNFVISAASVMEGEAPGPVRVGEAEFGTSPPMCAGDSWVSAVRCAQLPPYCLSLTTRFLKRGLMTTH